MNQKEQVFLNSCQLVLQEFSIKQKGFIYFVWKKGKKHIQSLKYQCNEQLTPMKQTLSLSLKTYAINGVMQKRYTHFSLFDGDGRQLDHIKFDVTEWKNQSTQSRIIMGSCALRIKVKRKVALELQNFHRHSKTQIEESSQQSDREANQNAKIYKKEELSIKQELAKAKRQIEDFDYITNKLKNDRNYYITQNENLRNKLADIHDDYGQQIMRLKNHYETRIEIRQSIYEEQIQELISTFNSNYEINRTLIEELIQEKYDYEHQIEVMKEVHQSHIEKQEENFQEKYAEMEHQLREKQRELEETLTKLSQEKNSNNDLQRKLSETEKNLKQTYDQLNKESQEHRKDNETWEKQIIDRQQTLQKRDEEIQKMKIQLETKDFQLSENEESMKHYRKMIEDFEKTVLEKQKTNHQIQTEKYNLTVQIERLKVIMEEQINQIEFHKASIDQLKEQDKIKEEEYISQYRSLEAIYNEKQIMYTNELKTEQEKYLEVTKENYDINIKIQQVEHENSLLNDQISILKNDNDQITQLSQQLREEMKQQSETFTKQYREYNQQIADLMSENNVFQAENAGLKDQIRELERKVEFDTANLKKDYEDLVQSKVKLYEDQLEFIKRQRDGDIQNFQKLKKQYESQIASLIQRETKENQEIQKMFRDEMEMKNKEFLELNENYKMIQQTYEDVKLRLEMVEEERQNLLKGKGGRNIRHDDDDMEIQEIMEESSDDEDGSDSESDSDSSEDNKKKKKKKNLKGGKDKKKEKEKDKKKKEKEKNKKKTKGKKKKQSSSQSSQSQSSELQQNSSQKQQDSQDPSQILANISDDDYMSGKKANKNFVQASENKAGSQKMISPLKDDELIYNTKQPQGSIGQIISIPVPQFVRQPDTRSRKEKQRSNRSEQKSVSSKKKKKKDKSQSEPQNLSQNSKVVKARDKVKELQKQIKTLKKQIKEYERSQVQHLAQIQEQEEQIKGLNMQIDTLVKKISKKDPKLAKKISSQIEEKRQQKSNSNKSRSQVSMRMPPIPRKQIENMKTENQYLKRSMEEKNRSIANIENEKNALMFKLQTLETTKAELEKRIGATAGMAGSQIEEGLKRSVLQLEGKFMGEKEKAQQIKLQMNKLAFQKEQLQNQNKKLKIKQEDLEEFIKKNQPTQTQKQLQKELQEHNRQFLQMSKQLNSAKLEKEASQEELRLMKKRYSQIIRASQQAETNVANLQREVEDLRRKENKNRRDIEDYQEEVKKYKDQVKQLQSDMNSLNTVQSQSLYQRKKVMDEVMKLEDALSNREFQVVKLNKEIDKLKNRIQQGDDVKVNKRNELLQERERLDSLLIKAQKRIQELEEQDKILKQRIHLLEQDSKKNLDEKKQTYGEKLRFYVEEITNIKQIVEDYQNQNSRLKIQNSQLYEHNQILKISFEKLEMKYEQVVQNEEHLLEQIDLMQKDIDQMGQEINQHKLQVEASNITIGNLRKELDTEKNVSKKKSDKLTAYEELNEKYLYEIKNLKIKLSEFETNLNENQLLTEKFEKNTKTIEELEYELRKLQDEYNNVINTYTYRKEDVEQAMRQLKEHEEKIKEEEITRVIEELDSTHSQKQASMEQQIIELFNENSKLRLSLQQKSDECSQNFIRIAQLEALPEKLKLLQRQRDSFEKSIYELNEQLKTVSQELRRADSKLNESIRNQEGKQTENVILSKRCEDIERKYKDLNQTYLELKKEEKRLIDRMKNVQEEKEKQVEKLISDVQHYQNKILSLQLEVGRLKETESTSSKEYVKKIKKLEEKIEEMSDTFKEHEETLESHYVAQIKKLEDSIQRLSDELEQKMQRIEELNEALIMLQQENDDLVGELTSTRSQMAQESEVYTNDVNNMRNQLRDAEEMYDANIKHLEEEMSALSKELTVLRYNRQTGSRLAGSGVGGDNNNSSSAPQNAKRLEQKIRMRDKRIEQLKTQILTMEESITKLMKKETTTENVSQAQIEKLKMNLSSTEGEFYELKKKYEQQTYQLNDFIKQLKREVMEWKNKNEQKELNLEEKDLEMESMKVELRTTKELYIELQHQLQKRKTHLNTQMEEESQLQAQIRHKNIRISQLTERLQESLLERNKIESQLKRKSLQVKRLSQKLNQTEINYRQVFTNQQKKNTEVKTAKQLTREVEQRLEKLTQENKKLKNQMALWQKENHQLKEELEYNTNSLAEVEKKLSICKESSSQTQHYARRYKEIDSLLQDEYQMNLEQFIQTNYWDQKLNTKDRDIQVLAEELEELRFLYDHKLLQLDDLKKARYELELKTEDNDFVYRQLNEVRSVCARLEEEKKDAVFREEALKLQLENLIESEDKNDITLKLQTILGGYYDN